VREAVLTNLWLTALNLQPYVRCRKASRAGSQTACLIKAGTLLNIWLYFHHGTHALRVLGVESSVCWIYGWTRRLTVPAGACTHACGEAQGDTMELASNVSLSGLWPKAELGSTHGILVWLFCLQNGTLRPASTRFVIGLQSHACSVSICAGRSMEEAGSMEDLVMRIPVTTY
jgi:hypothetical protein